MLRLGPGRRAGGGRPRPGRLPHLHGPPGRRAAAAGRHGRLRHPPHGRARAAAPGTSSRWRSSARPRSVTRVMASTTRHDGARPPSARPTRCWSAGARRRSSCPPWQRGLSDYLARRGHAETRRRPKRRSSASRRQPMLDWTRREREEREADGEEITGESELPSRSLPRRAERLGGRGAGRGMKLLVAGGAGFIGSNYVRLRLAEHPGRLGARARQAHLRRAAARTSTACPTIALRAGRGRHRRPRGGAGAASTAATRSSTSPPSPTSTARSRRPGEFITTDVFGTYVLLEAARDAGVRLPAVLDRRGLRRLRDGLGHRGVAARPLLARTRPRRPAAT